MSPLGSTTVNRTIIGYILPEKKATQAEDADSESEEEAQPEFLDMEEMENINSGGHMFNSTIPTRNEFEFLEIKSGKKCRVEGRFCLKDPWWETTCTTRKSKGKLVLQGYPAYRLRSDLKGDQGRSVLFLFLTACGVDPTFLSMFSDWLQTGREVGFANLMAVLNEFEEEELHKAAAQQIKALIRVSVAGKRVEAASFYPRVMKYLPSLLPGHISGLLGRGKSVDKRPVAQSIKARPSTRAPTQLDEEDNDEEEEEHLNLNLLAKLEGIIATDVWKLGFNHVMYKELKLVHCEAQLRSFQECKLLQQIPLKQHYALLVYDTLKSQCHSTGSTYMELQVLCEKVRWKSPFLGEEEVWDAVHFMKELGVVVCERRRVALQNLYSYEAGIAKCLRHLVESEPWVIPLDATQVLSAAARQRLSKKAGAEESGSRGEPDSVGARQKPSDACERSEMDGAAAELNRASAAGGSSAFVPAGPGPSHAHPDLCQPPADPADQQPPPLVALDPDQVRAMDMICSNPVTVISGKGGCGKTTVVSLVFRAAMQQQRKTDEEVSKACWDFQNDSSGSEGWGQGGSSSGRLSPTEGEVKEEGSAKRSSVLQGEDEVLLTAPTGRAASLLTKKTFKAYTLHQVLWSFMLAKKDGNGAPEGWKFARVRVLVVDEGSLVSVQLLHSVLTMLTEHAQLSKFIILGDVRQLPSIQPGNTLHDLFHSLASAHWAIEMKTNHRAESQLIVDNAGLISEMGMKNCSFRQLNYDAVLDLNGKCTIPSEDKSFIHILLPRAEDSDWNLQEAIELLLKADPGLKNDTTSQFIAFRRTECALINELCCKHYSNHSIKNAKNRLDFRCGDKVCCTKNGYVTDLNKQGSPEDEDLESSCVPDRAAVQQRLAGLDRGRESEATQSNKHGDKKKIKEKDKERLCNGEIFFITHDVTRVEEGSQRRRQNRYLTLDDRDGRTLCVSFRELQKECRLQHAWARTIHTFQGSETETVVYVLGNGSVQTWKHVYTAVTRGQKRVYIIAEREGMAAAVKRRIVPRNTRLGAMVKELLSQPDGSQPQPGTHLRPTPGFRPTQSTPQASHPPGRFFADAPGSPYRPPDGASRAPSTPVVAAPLGGGRVQPQSKPVVSRQLWKKEPPPGPKADTPCTSLMEDIAISETYGWSPMNSSSEEPSQEQPGGLCEERGTGEEDRSGAVPDGLMDGASASAAVFGTDQSPYKRMHSLEGLELDATPTKCQKTEPFDSPLGCSVLQQLSLRTPNDAPCGKRLFQNPPDGMD